MSYEAKRITCSTPSPSSMTPLSSSPNEAVMITESLIQPNQLGGTSHGPLGIFWDMENCPVPNDVRPEEVAGNIRMALRVHPFIKGAVTMFSAYGDFNVFPRRLREGCQRTGVKLVDVPNGRKDAADKAILVDMFLFALDNKPPSSVMLISGDVDFAPALHILGQRGYTIILVIPSGIVSSALSNAGRYVWDWASVAKGEGFVPPRNCIPRVPDISGYLRNRKIVDASNCLEEEEDEAIVYRGIQQMDNGARTSINQIYSYNSCNVSREHSSTSPSTTKFTSNSLVMPFFPCSRSQGLPSGPTDAPAVHNGGTEDLSWVRPGDIQGLKGQIVRLLEMSGGSFPLVRLPAEYLREFGRPLYMAEYGVCKLVHLIKKMSDVMLVVGSGQKRFLCLRNTCLSDKNMKKSPSTPAMLKKEKRKGALEENLGVGACINIGCSSDDFSDDDRITDGDDRLEGFRLEIEELLVCYSEPVPLCCFESLYEQRYKKGVDYRSYGVDGLEELLHKVRDVAEVRVDGSKGKCLFFSCVRG